VAAAYTLRERAPFKCAPQHDGVTDELSLVQLSVISAPGIGGSLGLNIRGPHRDDHGLDVVAIEDVPATRVVRAGLFVLMGVKRPVAGVHAMHVQQLAIDGERQFGLALDGELDAGEFDTLLGAIGVITARGTPAGEPSHSG
jgi:diacylglycerol kinase family enzyme